MFSKMRINLRAALRARVTSHVACVGRARRGATCGVACRAEHARSCKNTGFLPRCSNSVVVFAIPAGTGRYRHSLRLGGQHGEEAKDEGESSGEKGREEDQAPEEEVSTRCFPSLRLRTTSMTASNRPARVEERWRIAIALRHRRLRSTTEGVGETGLRASAVCAHARPMKKGWIIPRPAVAVAIAHGQGPASPTPSVGECNHSDRVRPPCVAERTTAATSSGTAPTARAYLTGSPKAVPAMRSRNVLRSSAAPRCRDRPLGRARIPPELHGCGPAA